MTRERQKLGQNGEKAALEFLEAKGLVFKERNYRLRTGEIDLIMLDRDILVFVEVRTRSKDFFGTPVETILREKRRRIIQTARHYLKQKRICDEVRCRFDIVGITVRENDRFEIEHIENAFLVTD